MWPMVAGLVLALAVAAADEPPVLVERVEVQGTRYLAADTLLFHVSTKAGDHFDELRLRDDFRRLWDTGFVDDLVLDVRDGARGKVVVFRVAERRRVQIVDYRGSKELSTAKIEELLKEKEAAIRLDSFFDAARARRAAKVIQEKLAASGRPFATVKVDHKSIGGSGDQVSFVIDDGPKARVKSVSFTGHRAFSQAKLRGRMKNLRQPGFFRLTWLKGRSTWSEEKWSDAHEGDRQRLEAFYLDHGYVTVALGEPKLTYTDGRSGLFRKKPVKWLHLEIPVAEGDRYRMGALTFEGLKAVREDAVRPLVGLEAGGPYRESRIRKAEEKLREVYGALGYFQWTMRIQRTPDAERKTVDVALVMDEDRRYYVGRIAFTGNTTTRDKVVRREVFLNEGDVFNTEALKLSIRRINQLGYFKPMEKPPDIQQGRDGEDRLDVVFRLEEQNRNQFTFGGGVSGLEGTFVNASFSTANFLGLGETVSLTAQAGARTRLYQLAVTEPYLFDRPLTAGLDLYARQNRYETAPGVVGYAEARTGASLTAGLPLGRFTRLYANHTFEVIDVAGAENLAGGTAALTGEPVYDPFSFGTDGRTNESRFTPSLIFNTVDNPYTPRRGTKLTASGQLAGGWLGGDTNAFRPQLEAITYLPHARRTALGLRLQGGWAVPFGPTIRLPYYQRFFLGGENEIRGVNARTVGPVDEQNRALGGNKFVLFNAEYYFDLAGPLRALLFYDAGQSFLEGRRVDLRQLRTSTGAELRFLMPVLNVPFRLIYAWNFSRDGFQPDRAFKFAVGTTF
jgi:outer membrane protein insertion porin family